MKNHFNKTKNGLCILKERENGYKQFKNSRAIYVPVSIHIEMLIQWRKNRFYK